MIAGGARAAVRSNYRRVCEIEVDEREAHPSRDRKGAFAGHAFSQRSLTGCPLGPALPGVRSTPGFSRLAGVYVNRLTFMSHKPGSADAAKGVEDSLRGGAPGKLRRAQGTSGGEPLAKFAIGDQAMHRLGNGGRVARVEFQGGVARRERPRGGGARGGASLWRSSPSVTRRCIASAMAAGSRGSNFSAAPPAMLFIGSIREQAVGTPAASASRTGNPKPSNRLG